MSNILEQLDKLRAKKLKDSLAKLRRKALKGDAGEQGLVGLTGLAGLAGLDGTQGLDGIPGAAGPRGLAGLDGVDGITTVITKEVLVDQTELLEALEELRREYERLKNNVVGGVHGFSASLPLVHVIEVTEDTTITTGQLDANKYNVILVKTAGITVTLPENNQTILLEVKQGYEGTETYTVCGDAAGFVHGTGALVLDHDGQYYSEKIG